MSRDQGNGERAESRRENPVDLCDSYNFIIDKEISSGAWKGKKKKNKDKLHTDG